MAIVFLLISLLWIFCLRKDDDKLAPIIDLNPKLYIIAFFLFLSTTLLWIYSNGEHLALSSSIYLFVPAAGVLLFLQIMNKRDTPIPLMFGELLVIPLLLSASQILVSPFTIGNDSWTHRYWVNHIVDTGNILSGTPYSMQPICDAIVAATSIMTSMGYKFSAFFVMTVAFVFLACLLVYALSRKFINTPTFGLLSVFFLMFSDKFIGMAIYEIPNGFALGFLLILFLLMTLMPEIGQLRLLILLAFFYAVLMLTHTITTLFAMLVFLIFFVVYSYNIFSKVVDIDRSEQDPLRLISKNLLAFVVVLTLTWWTFASNTMADIARLLKGGFSTDFLTSSKPSGYAIVKAAFPSTLASELVIVALVALALVGYLYLLSRKVGRTPLLLLIAPLIAVGIPAALMVVGLSVFTDRWLFFAEVLLVPIVALAFILLMNRFRTARVKMAIGAGIVLLLSIGMLISPSVNVLDDRPLSDVGVRDSLTSSEMASGHFLAGYNLTGKAGSDITLLMAINYYYGGTVKVMDARLYTGNFSEQTGYVILRSEIEEHRFRIYDSSTILDYKVSDSLTSYGFGKVYSSGSSSVFLH